MLKRHCLSEEYQRNEYKSIQSLRGFGLPIIPKENKWPKHQHDSLLSYTVNKISSSNNRQVKAASTSQSFSLSVCNPTKVKNCTGQDSATRGYKLVSVQEMGVNKPNQSVKKREDYFSFNFSEGVKKSFKKCHPAKINLNHFCLKQLNAYYI